MQTVGNSATFIPPARNILFRSHLPSSGRIAGQHGHFTMEDYRKRLKKAERDGLARALKRLSAAKPVKSLPVLETLRALNG
ncbi:MAG: hypothetical protein OEZ40_07215 [Candidatus Bathyarchaeota archaeon]|nr:hypothetical protein [Candidatus Bathyarchaeota archaeon]